MQEFDEIITICRSIFEKKTKDYGTSWRIMRLSTVTDQILIKAKRIRSIQEKRNQKVGDTIRDEFIGIINYCIIGMIQLNCEEENDVPLDVKDKTVSWYDYEVTVIKELLFNKNHDYGEAWRDMRITSITDIILMKLFRIKQIEDNNCSTIISEGVGAGYQDIVNYSIFSLILMNQNDI